MAPPKPILEVPNVTKPELGNKHQCQSCGTKFFDLNKNPILCPKCGTVFHAVPLSRVVQRATVADDDEVDPEVAADIISLQDAEVEDKVVADVDDEVELEDEEADETFLAEEEEDNDDVADLIDGDLEDDEDR